MFSFYVHFEFSPDTCFLNVLQELDIAIVKATNHVEHPAKEKYIRGKHQTVVLRRCNLPYYSNKLHSEWDLIELFDSHFQPFFLPSRLPDLELMLHTAFMLLREGCQRHIIGRYEQ